MKVNSTVAFAQPSWFLPNAEGKGQKRTIAMFPDSVGMAIPRKSKQFRENTSGLVDVDGKTKKAQYKTSAHKYNRHTILSVMEGEESLRM